MKSFDGQERFIEDMFSIGLLGHSCLGCSKFGCDSCPAGTGVAVDYSKLAPETAERLKQILEQRKVSES